MSAEPAPRDISTVERAVLDAVDPDRVVELASELITVPSVSAEETPGQELAARLLAEAGTDVETWEIDVDDLAAHPAYSAEFERGRALGVVGRRGAGVGPALLVDAHVDVVPPGDPGDWTTPAFAPAVRDGRLYGRGACDTKGGLAAAIHAAEAIRDAGVELDGTLAVASVVGEEDGGCGTLALLEHGVSADGCIVVEPTRLAVAPASAGALSWRIRIRGLAAHGCLREEGVSAIEAFWPVHRAVEELERHRNDRPVDDELFGWLDRPFAICGGRISGGDWPSSEADWLLWEGRYGVAPGEDLAAARAEFEEAIASAARGDTWLADHPPEVEWWGGQFLPGTTDVDDPVATTTASSAADVLGAAPETRGMPYGCDLGLTVNIGGIPTVVFGPGDIRDAHRPNESVAIVDLVAAARTLALTALRYCGANAG